jgi:hypothetical protein
MSHTSWKEAELLQIQMGRALLGVGRSVANDVVRGDLGWWTMKGRSDLAKLRFWGKILQLPNTRILRSVYNARRAEYAQFPTISSWCRNIHQLLIKLGLGQCWISQKIGTLRDWMVVVKKKYRATRRN